MNVCCTYPFFATLLRLSVHLGHPLLSKVSCPGEYSKIVTIYLPPVPTKECRWPQWCCESFIYRWVVGDKQHTGFDSGRILLRTIRCLNWFIGQRSLGSPNAAHPLPIVHLPSVSPAIWPDQFLIKVVIRSITSVPSPLLFFPQFF